jgi:hypothetical protein
MMKPTILTLATVLALSAAPAMAGLSTNNTVSANGLTTNNTVVANGLNMANTRADNAVARNEVHLVGATGAAVADGNVVVLRLVAVEYAPQ